MNQPFFSPGHVPIGGDFATVFDPEDYLAMINALDEATVVLRAHLVLEEFLNIWASKVTGTDDLFAGAFVSFKIKLAVCKNLGLATDLNDVLDKFNEIRNRYSHRRKYAIEASAIESLSATVDTVACGIPLQQCRDFEIYANGVDGFGKRGQVTHSWSTSDPKKKLTIVQVVLVLKLVHWMQSAFNAKGIKYTLVVSSLLGQPERDGL